MNIFEEMDRPIFQFPYMLDLKKLGICAFCFLGLLMISCSSSYEEEGMEIREEESEGESLPLKATSEMDVTYGDHPRQRYDIYLPEGRSTSKTKVILLVHGGGWIEGDKSSMTPFIDLIKERHPDHAIVNMNYILASPFPEVPAFPNQFLDIDQVVEQLVSERETLQILPEFGMIGASAGAHLSLMYDFVYDTEDRVKFVVDIVGPTDFTHPFFSEDPNFGLALALFVDESQYPGGTDYAKATSPAFNVSPASSPVALFYGNQDPLVPLDNGVALDSALTANEIPHDFTVYTGGHGDDWSEADIVDLQEKISGFIREYLPVE